ncbi:MAG: HAMP domain-containing histidine kinase [Treponema sp.]|nr:HAMP domain-containing histidine kinase [Treponema sp.]
MTIKKRLFFSNIRMVLISLWAFGLAGRILHFFIFGSERPGTEAWITMHDAFGRDVRITLWVVFLILSVTFASIINNFFTHRITKRITRPLEMLNGGVRQIHANNFAHRIDYKGNDEFRPICEAFNEMAEKLETSTVQRQKDESARRELIAGISHDLRTPLTSIKGCLEGIETGVASSPEMREKYLSIVKNKTVTLEYLIEQFFLFAKLDMDEFPLDLRRTDISLAVCDMIEDSLSEYAAKGLSINVSDMPKNAYVLADVIMLRNVIINILENSVRYKTKEQGQMEISAVVDGDAVLLRLTDNGPGVQADALPKLFDVFYRADPSRSKRGSGMGLAISAKIVERMGGSIHAEPSAVGTGLATVIRLPLAASWVKLDA